MGRLVDYFPGNNFYGYCVKKIEKEKKTSNLIYYVIIGDKVFYVSRETLFSTI